MSGCCEPGHYDKLFNEEQAQRSLHRYRRKGLDRMARSMVAQLQDLGLKGARVLEVGGGIGAIQVELLAAGASDAVNVEISSGYEGAARDLLADSDMEDRATRMIADFVEEADEIESADVVVMNRVVCCYPDMERMITAAAGKTRQALALSLPRDRWFMRWNVRLIAAWCRLRGSDFRFFVHKPAAIVAAAKAQGMELEFEDRDAAWQAMVLLRTP
jgi:magnesium-protoporphyrin O-methyltransferase